MFGEILKWEYKLNYLQKAFTRRIVNKVLKIEGDKSLSIRWALIASQASGKSKAYNLLKSDDVLNTVNCLKKLGMKIKFSGTSCEIFSKGLNSFKYKKNIILGEIFNQKFKINFKENLKNINFKLLNTGIYFQLNFLDNLIEPYSNGTLKGRILSSNIRIDFSSKKNIIEISQLFLRDKYFSIDGKGNLKLKPFFKYRFSSLILNIG